MDSSTKTNRRQKIAGLLWQTFIVCLLALSLRANAQDLCLELLKGNIAVDVNHCAPFTPALFDRTRPEFRFLDDLDPAGKKSLYKSYSGLVIQGTVVMSNAIRDGISTTKGALQGEKSSFFVKAGLATCETIKSKRITALLTEKCCNGSADVPCLLNNGYTLTNLKITGGALVGYGAEIKRIRKPHSKIYTDALTKYSQKKYEDAVDLFLQAEKANELDVTGRYYLGFSYRVLENCKLAIPVLTKIWSMKQANNIWADEEEFSRRGIFLLSRCHAKSGSAAEAIFYLNNFLLDPKKYRQEIQQSMTHKDFGWIHNSKEYIEYKAVAEKKIK